MPSLHHLIISSCEMGSILLFINWTQYLLIRVGICKSRIQANGPNFQNLNGKLVYVNWQSDGYLPNYYYNGVDCRIARIAGVHAKEWIAGLPGLPDCS